MPLLDKYQVGTDGPWSVREAGHLCRRAGFGATPAERANAVGIGEQADFEAAVDRLVDISPEDPLLDQGPSAIPPFPGAPLSVLPDDDSDLGLVKNPVDHFSSIGQWLYRMRYTSQPLQEQLTLFFHDHMVSENDKLLNVVPPAINLGNDGSVAGQLCSGGTLPPNDTRNVETVARLLRDQNTLFRTTGIDSFGSLLINVTRNPAMLLYLDNITNFRGRAQENFARELMELFSMGVGNYSEKDIQEIAKVMTGETIAPYVLGNFCESNFSTDYGFVFFVHESGSKTVFGQEVPFSLTGQETETVIGLILDKVSVTPDVSGLDPPYNDLPATAVHMSWKLLRWFVSHDIQLKPNPDPIVLELADYMRGSDDAPYPQRRFPYDFRAVLRKIFLSKTFYDESNFYNMYKTPADYVVSALRGLELAELFTSVDFGPSLVMILMGMRLYNPPNVAGWNHGKSWITSGNLLMRYNYAFRVAHLLLSGEDYGGPLLDGLLQRNGGPIQDEFDHEGMVNYVGDRLIQEPLTEDEFSTLLSFLNTTPLSSPPADLYREKMRGLIHVAMTMPRFQLK